MSDRVDEWLSALLDNELPPAETGHLLQHAAADPAVAEQLRRYRIIGDCLRGEVTLTAPLAPASAGPEAATRPSAQRRHPPRSFFAHRRRRRLGAAALAASVSALALGIALWLPLPGAGPEAPAVASEQLPAPTATPASAPAPAALAAATGGVDMLRLSDYLADHTATVAPGHVGGFSPYVSVVSHGAR